MRLFVGLDPPPAARRVAETICARAREVDSDTGLRWARASNIHLTLHFLGETSADRAVALGEALDAIVPGTRAPRLAITGVGGFPDLRRPAVIWLGLEEEPGTSGRLAALHAAVAEALRGLGWQLEPRPFQAHVTVARSRDRERRRRAPPLPAAVREALAAAMAPPVAPGAAPISSAAPAWRRLVLVESTPEPGGSRYVALREWTLAED
jgi:2'-5' RNA ligase